MAKDMESDDPYEMVGVLVPTAPGEDATGQMALSFVEEYALMGFTGGQILHLFRNPFYAGAHMVYEQRGEAYVQEIIDQVLSPTGEGERNG
jgi:hypothetical protein